MNSSNKGSTLRSDGLGLKVLPFVAFIGFEGRTTVRPYGGNSFSAHLEVKNTVKTSKRLWLLLYPEANSSV
jgi:hypothetical protein